MTWLIYALNNKGTTETCGEKCKLISTYVVCICNKSHFSRCGFLYYLHHPSSFQTETKKVHKGQGKEGLGIYCMQKSKYKGWLFEINNVVD